MNILFRYTSLIGLLVVLANSIAFYLRAERLGNREPEKRAGYWLIAHSWLLYFGGLALILAAGELLGLATLNNPRPTGSVLETRVPLTWFDWFALGVIAVVFVRFSIWLYFRDGAELLVAHNEMLNGMPGSPTSAKILWPLAVLACVGSVVYRLAG